MTELNDIFIAVGAIVAATATIVARFNETPSELGFFKRLMRALDLSQIFDNTRSLDDPDGSGE